MGETVVGDDVRTRLESVFWDCFWLDIFVKLQVDFVSN